MVVGLYTSRVVLKALGETDFGIYGVVGGVLTLFKFLKLSITNCTQRFISYAVGKKDTVLLRNTFTTSLYIHLIIGIVIVILCESIGVWFLNNVLNIPNERMAAANWVLQFSIISVFFTITSIPYIATIIAHEKMSAFAYLSLLEAFLKLGIAIAIDYYGGDRLILYAGLLALSVLIIRVAYNIYCGKHFTETGYSLKKDKSIIKEFTSFVSWNMYMVLATFGPGQGLNMLLNIFFGPAVNAARSISYTVQGHITQFTHNFMVAVRPQIVKYYAEGDLKNMYKLMFRSAKFSFFLMFVITLPIWICSDQILEIWLDKVPRYSVEFCDIVLLINLVNVFSNPLLAATQATGNMKLHSILGGTNLLLILPVAYIVLKMGGEPMSVFYVSFIFYIFHVLIKLYVNKKILNFPIMDFLKNNLLKCWAIAILIGILPYYLHKIMPQTILSMLFVFTLCLILSVSVIYLYGLDKTEKGFLRNKISSVTKKFKKRNGNT